MRDGCFISVIIPHLNQPSLLHECLNSLDKQSLDRKCFEIIVVDNGSSQRPEAVVALHEGVRLIDETEPGPGMARNRGVQASSGAILAFIDADCRAHADWLRNALFRFEREDAKTLLGGDVQIWRERQDLWTAVEAYECVFAYRFQLYIKKHGFSGTGNLIVRRSDFDNVGPFGGIQIAEDVEWGRRALKAGCKFKYVPEVIVHHPARQSLRELIVKWDRHIQHDANLDDGSYSWKFRWILRAFAVLASPAYDFLKVLSSNRLRRIAPRVKALLILTTVRAYRAWRMLSLLLKPREGVAWNREGKAVTSKASPPPQ